MPTLTEVLIIPLCVALSLVCVVVPAPTKSQSLPIQDVALVETSENERIRVVIRTRDTALPALLYQPFAYAWPQLHAGDAYFLPLNDTFTLVTFDPRGVGESTGTFDTEVGTMVDDVLSVARHTLSRLPGVKLYILGISTAAGVTARAIHKAPQLFAAAILAAPVINMKRTWPHLSAEIQRVWGVPAWVSERLPDVAMLTLALLRVPYLRCHERWLCSGEFYNPLTYIGSEFYPAPFTTYLRAGFAMVRASSETRIDFDHLTHFAIPITLIAGAHDYGVAPNEITDSYIDSLTSSVKAIRIPESSHAVHIEQPGAFQHAVRYTHLDHLKN